MPSTDLKIYVGGERIDLYPDTKAVTISYSLEDRENFQVKTSAKAPEIDIPATRRNGQILGVPELTDSVDHSGILDTPVPAMIEAEGIELLNGPAIPQGVIHTDHPVRYTVDFLGDNGDWITRLKDVTLYDVLKTKSYVYSRDVVEQSWNFTGMDENQWFVFIPVRYARPMASAPVNLIAPTAEQITDFNMTVDYMRPSISLYFLMVWAFRLIGYRLTGELINTSWFRRICLLWTWGSYLYSSGTEREKYLFEAKSSRAYTSANQSEFVYIDLKIDNDTTDGMFDNGSVGGSPGNYIYNIGLLAGEFTYPSSSTLGQVAATFRLQMSYEASTTESLPATAGIQLFVRWFKVSGSTTTQIKETRIIGIAGNNTRAGIWDESVTVNINPGDKVQVRFYKIMTTPPKTLSDLKAEVVSLKLDYLEIVPGTMLNFSDYTNFKNFKITDLIAGCLDLFNGAVKADPIRKIVYLEPLHPYSLAASLATKSNGYFTGRAEDWSNIQDRIKENKIKVFRDGQREQVLEFKTDDADGIAKKVRDRSGAPLGSGKYVLPFRFQSGDPTKITNRFFSATMHYEVKQWEYITGSAPQMIVLKPENISNTSASESESTFQPKLAYYKGPDSSQGWVYENNRAPGFPYGFAVNYRPGGQNDPILSYSDEQIGTADAGFSLGIGFLKRFYWQRFATMRHGKYYDPGWLRLNNTQMSDVYQRLLKIIRGNKWELVQVSDYDPTSRESTECFLRQSREPGQEEAANTFPSQTSVLAGVLQSSNFDTKYNPLKGLASDLFYNGQK